MFRVGGWWLTSPATKPPLQEVLDDMYELAISTTIFTSMLESAAAEQSSRMNAMEVRYADAYLCFGA